MPSYLQTTNDLREDALFRAGEPQSTSSQFWARSLVYLNRIQRDLALGGGASVGQSLAAASGFYGWAANDSVCDFFWLRRLGRLNTTTGQSALTVTATLDSTAITLSAAPTVNISGWRISIANLRTVPKIAGGAGTAWLLDEPWPETTQTAKACILFQPEYDLPSDFIRFASPPYSHGDFSRTLSVGVQEQMYLDYPWSTPIKGQPSSAYRVGDQRIAINSYDTRPHRIEFEYIALPPDLIADSIPIVPKVHRSVLATGAAMLIMFDKNDDRVQNLASEYREQVHRMVQAHNRALTGGSSEFGVFRVREAAYPQRARQTYGELFLI